MKRTPLKSTPSKSKPLKSKPLKSIKIDDVPNDVVAAINTLAEYCRSVQGARYNPFKCRKCPLYGKNTDRRATVISGDYEDCFFSMYRNSIRRWDTILKGKQPDSSHSAFDVISPFEVMSSSTSIDDELPEDRSDFQIKDQPLN